MASKGQKFNKYSSNIKELIIQELNNGYSSRYLARKYGLPRGTISNWEQKILHPEKNIIKKRGRPKEKDLTKEDYKERYEILKKYQAFLKAQRERK